MSDLALAVTARFRFCTHPQFARRPQIAQPRTPLVGRGERMSGVPENGKPTGSARGQNPRLFDLFK